MELIKIIHSSYSITEIYYDKSNRKIVQIEIKEDNRQSTIKYTLDKLPESLIAIMEKSSKVNDKYILF